MNFQVFTLSSQPEWACLQVKAPDSESRTPVHLCCVIDTSASMQDDNKLKNVKQSLQFLLDFLGPQDSISVITFSETAKTILTQTFVNATEKDNIRTRISIISTELQTNLSAGIIQARDSLQINTNNVKQGILLLTDGEANMGLTHSRDILNLIRNTVNTFNGTSISSVGYGTNHNVELLQSISTEGGGSYYVVNNLENVATVFGDILGGLVSCVAQQVRVILPVGTEIKSRYATNTIGDQMEILIGDMAAGAEAAFLAKIPIGLPVILKGYDLVTHTTFNLNSTVSRTDDTTLQVSGEAHYLRFEVMTLLEQSRRLMNYTSTSTDVNAHITKINDCINTITTYRAVHGHSLWDILLNELNACKHSLENRNMYDISTPHIMTQHAGYLGRMRGLPAALAEEGEEVYEDPDNIQEAATVSHTFSNFAQRQISSQLAATVSANVTRLHDALPTSPNSCTTSPILRASTPFPSTNNGPYIPASQEFLSFSESLPPPIGSLTRQIACCDGIYHSSTSSDNEEDP